VFFPSISPDGKHIVFQHDFDLYTLDVPSGKPKKLSIAMAFDPKESEIVVVSTQSRAEGFAIAPAGDYMAVDYHGEIVVTPTEQGVGERTQITNSPGAIAANRTLQTAARSPTSPTRAASNRCGSTI
jgi:tricorn protease-like protein